MTLDHPLQQVPCEWPNGSFKTIFPFDQADGTNHRGHGKIDGRMQAVA